MSARINLLWPTWARIAEPISYRVVVARGWRCWRLIQKAAALAVDAMERERRARLVRRVFLSLVIVFALSAVANAQEGRDEDASTLYRALGFGVHAAKAGDFVSTEFVLASGGVELNPWMQRRDVRFAATALYPFAFNWTTEVIRKDGHPKIALWMRVGFVVAHGYAIQHNLRTAFQ